MMRAARLRALVWGASIVGGGIACGVITLPAVPVAPSNTCTDDPSCATTFGDAGAQLGTCTGGACSGAASFVSGPFLVVAVPRSSTGVGGSTLVLPDNYGALRPVLAGTTRCETPNDSVECDPLPPITTFLDGWLLVHRDIDYVLWPPGGLRPNQNKPNDSTPTTLPVGAVFHMLWKDPASGDFVLASKLGIPLDDVIALEGPKNAALWGTTTSPSHVPGTTFLAHVPQPLSPSDPTTSYELEIIPKEPFDTFPPLIVPITPPALTAATLTGATYTLAGSIPDYMQPDAGGAIAPLLHYEIDELAGAPNLAGWTVHVDNVDGRRVSGNVKLAAGAIKNVVVVESLVEGVTTPPSASQFGQTLFIDPPPGVDLPRYAAPASGPLIIGPFMYPALPAQVTVSGFVLTADNQTPATAHVTFFADNSPPSPYLVSADGVTPAPLEYTKSVATTSAAQYAASLFPGVLRAYIVPDDPDLALTIVPAQIVTLDALQSGRTLFVNRRTHVKGRVVLPDGTPVYAADVDISASADSPLPPVVDPLARPREVTGKTDVDGRFDIPSDPGLVDISVRPIEGSRFPWVVLTNRVVAPSSSGDAGATNTLTVADVTIPLPSRYTRAATGQLTDSAGNILAHAVVRAYAFPELTTTGDAGVKTSRGARLIGMTTTDDTGLYQLFLAPPDPE